jgi:serine/threonine protein kinase
MGAPSLQDGGKAMSSKSCIEACLSLQSLDFPGEAFLHLQDSGKTMSPRDSDKPLSLQDSDEAIQDSDPVDYGFFVDFHDHEALDVEEYAEIVNDYSRDLYYPICIGDVLVQTYRIEHKLGHGGFSTVWLARDIQEEKDVALKIIISGNAGEDEYKMQTEILRTVQDTSNLLTYLKTFSLPGHHSDHRVLVFPLRGPSIGSSLEQMSLPVAACMSAARQLLKALEQLHDAGIVHRGELTPACRSLTVYAKLLVYILQI